MKFGFLSPSNTIRGFRGWARGPRCQKSPFAFLWKI